MTKLSVLTLTRNRSEFLENLLTGLARSSRMPDECIVVHMNEPAADSVHAKKRWPFPCHHHTYISNVALPLPQARNVAARKASGDILLFLDVPESVTMGKVNYLHQDATFDLTVDCTDAMIRSQSKHHPKRDIDSIAPLIYESDYGLFWSLSFALTRQVFEQLGGFSNCYPSYGAEDTDFAWIARARGGPLIWVPDAVAYHQWHTSSVPPTHNFDSIVHNARVFYERWGEWPMGSWLANFVEKGYIEWLPSGRTLRVIERPQQARPLFM